MSNNDQAATAGPAPASRQKAARKPRRSRILVDFMGSMSLAITLLVALAIASVIGTVLVQNEPYTEYLMDYGPFWHEIFAGMGLYQVYSATWFLLVVAFLVISTSFCVYRQTPGLLKDLRRYNTQVKEKSLRSFHSSATGDLDQSPEEFIQHAHRVLKAQGFKAREKNHDGQTVIAAMRGRWNRMGYLLTHVGIVVICVGALADGTTLLKVNEWLGNLEIETRSVPISEVPRSAWIPDWNPSFRGSVEIPEGASANVVFLPMREGYFVQELPFRVELEEFRIERFSTGAESSYESDLVIHDPNRDEPLRHTISVNHPLIYNGFAIYQASFADGGTRLDIDAIPLGAEALRELEVPGRVFQEMEVPTPDGDTRIIEFTNFQLENVVPLLNEEGVRENRHMGPSFDFRLMDRTGHGLYYRNYQRPALQEGAMYFLSGVRESPAEEFHYLFLPADADDSLERFRTYLAMLHNPEVRNEIARQVARDDETVPNEQTQAIARTTAELMGLFAEGGYMAVNNEIERRVPGERIDEVRDLMIRILHAGLQGLYMEVLQDEGVVSIQEEEQRFLEDTISAINAISLYQSPFFFHLKDFEHREASGLQIARAPGQSTVYTGSVMLIVGIFFLFYVSYQRLWIMARRSENGEGTHVVMAGTSNRHQVEFEERFAHLKRWIIDQKPVDGASDGTHESNNKND
ncbi:MULTISPECIES: cytochrome c biogenesis protein ResB [unclassified Thioalkalivibrio]|uniref:cytochrome c biogenesis protein ResB n=1 Tax=unclassified Thioalkalivibrio TaxID=2621013 RepID=UPI00036A3325|nr:MULTISPECIES: cytochrome c biogenesis protein ResB [unclassified Thioalkalivibrio]